MQADWYIRYYEDKITDWIKPGKALVFTGPRRVGKTELIKKWLTGFEGKVYAGTGDNLELRDLLSSQNLNRIRLMFEGYDLIFIDEAQRIPGIGYGLKLIVDHMPHIKLIVTGSSSFDLTQKIGEPMTGRFINRILYPLSVLELHYQFGGMTVNESLDELLVYGSYPEVLSNRAKEDKIEYLRNIRDSYLLKDVLELENIRNPAKLSDLLKLLAFQIGKEVSHNELSNSLGIAKQSVERYLDILEKAFIIKKTGGFSRNLRNEVSQNSRYFFWDNGIRNALINNYNPIEMRNDVGMLWENFLFIERLKKQEYHRIYTNNYFWRTYDRKEIDLVEERDGRLYGFEFKWKEKSVKAPAKWLGTYENATFEVIHKNNFLSFLI